MKYTSKILILTLALAFSAFGQTATAPATAPATTPTVIAASTPLANVTLPTYLFAGGSFDQSTGQYSGVVSGIIPESNTIGLLGTATVNLNPFKYVNPANGRTEYLLGYSARVGQFKTVFNDGKNMVVIGGDAGAAVSNSVSGGISIGLSGSFSAGYFRQIGTHFGIGGVGRFLYMPGVGPGGSGAFNLVPELGLVWKP